MKEKFKWFVSGVLLSMAIFSLTGTALAAISQRQATLSYSGVQLTLDGEKVALTDANRNVVEPCIIDGTTYLPVASVAKALGLDVKWDGATNTVALTTGGNTESSTFTLSPGCYEVGVDITPGKYDCVAVSGQGVLRGEVASLGSVGLVQTMGVSSEYIQMNDKYNNLVLADGDVIYIELSLNVQFTKK